MSTLSTCLWFPPEVAPQAVEFYERVVPQTRVASTQAFTNADQPGGEVRVWTLNVAGTSVHVMGAAHAQPFTMGHSMWLVVDDQAQLDVVWDAFLEAGGQAFACGWIADPYGVMWQIVPRAWEVLTDPSDPARAQRVAEALWGMVRPDIAALEAAAGEA